MPLRTNSSAEHPRGLSTSLPLFHLCGKIQRVLSLPSTSKDGWGSSWENFLSLRLPDFSLECKSLACLNPAACHLVEELEASLHTAPWLVADEGYISFPDVPVKVPLRLSPAQHSPLGIIRLSVFCPPPQAVLMMVNFSVHRVPIT